MKKRTLTIAISLLACVALLGVGFASWIITADFGTETEGNVTVDTVRDDSITFSNVRFEESKDTIKFAPVASGEGAWLVTEGSVLEQLEVVIMFDVSNEQYALLNETNGIKVTVAEVLGTNTLTYADAQTAGYVGALPYSTEAAFTKSSATGSAGLSSGQYYITTSETTTTITLKISFTWGSTFGGQNPTDYYNSKTVSSELINDANTKLAELYKLSGLKFKVTIAPARKTA